MKLLTKLTALIAGIAVLGTAPILVNAAPKVGHAVLHPIVTSKIKKTKKVHVKAYTRHLKNGKTVHVKAHTRTIKVKKTVKVKPMKWGKKTM